MEYEWCGTIEKKDGSMDINFTVSTSWLGLGPVLSIGDFSYIFDLHFFIFHLSILRHYKIMGV